MTKQYEEILARALKAKEVSNNRATKGIYVSAGGGSGYVFTKNKKDQSYLDSHVCDLKDPVEEYADDPDFVPDPNQGMTVLQRGWGEAQHTENPDDFMDRNQDYLLNALNDYPKLANDCLTLLKRISVLEARNSQLPGGHNE